MIAQHENSDCKAKVCEQRKTRENFVFATETSLEGKNRRGK